MPGFISDTWNAISAPPKTPAPIVAKLNKTINDIIAAPRPKRGSLISTYRRRRHPGGDAQIDAGRDRPLERRDQEGGDPAGIARRKLTQ